MVVQQIFPADGTCGAGGGGAGTLHAFGIGWGISGHWNEKKEVNYHQLHFFCIFFLYDM